MARPETATRRQLVLHIGTPKAGTTSIQQMLRNLAPQLLDCGVAMLTDGMGRPKLRVDSAVFGRPNGPPRRITVQRLLRNHWWRTLAEQMDQSPAKRFVVSQESLLGLPSMGTPGALAELAKRSGREVRVIAYVRPQCQYLESRYAQWVKKCFELLPFDEFLAASFAGRPVESHPWLNYRRVFAPWRAAFGDRLTVVPLEPSRLERGLLSHLLEELGAGDLDTGAFKTRNPRPGAKAVEVLRLIGRALRARGMPPRRQAVLRARLVPKLVGPDSPFAGLALEEAHVLMARFAPENAAFAREYGIDPGGVLFRDPVINDGRRPNLAAWSDLDERERQNVRERVRRELGVRLPPGRRTRRRPVPFDAVFPAEKEVADRRRFVARLPIWNVWYRNARR